jgi:hypothetical protein
MSPRRVRRNAKRRALGFVAAAMLAAIAVLIGPSGSASANAPATPRSPLSGQCTTAQWQDPSNFKMCVGKLADLGQERLTCLSAPTPETPDSGMAGWFASEPASSMQSGVSGLYSQYGYAGYDFQMYDVGCVSPLTHPSDTFEDTVANGEFMFATSVIGASNALRERSWEPQSMWGWADPLVDKATKSIYARVFTVFGAVTLAVVGLYLLWRSRQSDMSNAMTTAGWAVFVMVAITAIAAWPVRAAHLADQSLVGGLNVVHSAIGPAPATLDASACPLPDPTACVDHRPPAVRASDTVTESMLYRNWLRGLLGSADSTTAKKYGPVLYDAKSLTWQESQKIAKNPATRAATIADKQQEWLKVAEQIKAEDPEAYAYLQGNQGMDRVGAGFIAILSSLFFAMFDITASILVLIGFLIFRWAVIAAPVLGTVGILRPASAGLRRLANSVIAAIFNIVIFGTGAAVYLFAVDLIMTTTTLPGWLQVVLVWLVGVVGWLLLRPYRRITAMGGRDSTATVATAGSWHRRFFREFRAAARLDLTEPGRSAAPRQSADRGVTPASTRPETRSDNVREVESSSPRRSASALTARRRPAGDWTEPDTPDDSAGFTIYRPGSGPSGVPARRPESNTVGA